MSPTNFLNTELKTYWEISGIRDSTAFFRMLPIVLPLDTLICFEGVSIDETVKVYLQTHSIAPKYELPRGTLWPRSAIFHVRADAAFINGIAKLTENHAEPEICDHIQAYAGEKTVFTWFDAFQDPLRLTTEVHESKVTEFCNRLQAGYKRISVAG